MKRSITSSLGTTALVLLGLAACSSSSDTGVGVGASCPGVELVAAASDYSSSVLCGAPPCDGPGISSVQLGKDPLLTASNGRAFYLVRDADKIFEVDPACGTAIGLAAFDVRQADVALADIHDVAAAKDGSLFVALYNVPRIVVLRKDGTQERVIDLSMYDTDGNPQADSIAITEVGGVEKAFVTLERLDNSAAAVTDGTYLRSKQASKMLRIDVATRTPEETVDLVGRNPFNTIRELAGGYYLAEPGNFDQADEPLSGIERFDTATSTTKLLVAEKDLGASVAEVAVTDGCGAAIVAGPQKDKNPTALVTFDPASGAVLTTYTAPVLATDGFDLQGLTWNGDTLYVGDRRAAGATYPVHVYTREPGTCILHDTGRTVTLPQKPVAFRASSASLK